MPSYNFDWSIVAARWPDFVRGAWLDVAVAATGFLLACVAGLFLAGLRTRPSRVIRATVFIVAQIARGIPPYVLLIWFYFALPLLTGVKISAFQAAIATIAFSGAGYTLEVFRASSNAIGDEQRDGARVLGLNSAWIAWSIVFPQAARIAIGPLGNIFVGHLKVATVMSVIAIPDMVFVAEEINYSYLKPFEGYTVVALFFLGTVALFSFLLRAIERWMELPA
jgi:His/Glu/Gln/Arg/opine family amino acid ABC transporter permease subunit